MKIPEFKCLDAWYNANLDHCPPNYFLITNNDEDDDMEPVAPAPTDPEVERQRNEAVAIAVEELKEKRESDKRRKEDHKKLVSQKMAYMGRPK